MKTLNKRYIGLATAHVWIGVYSTVTSKHFNIFGALIQGLFLLTGIAMYLGIFLKNHRLLRIATLVGLIHTAFWGAIFLSATPLVRHDNAASLGGKYGWTIPLWLLWVFFHYTVIAEPFGGGARCKITPP